MDLGASPRGRVQVFTCKYLINQLEFIQEYCAWNMKKNINTITQRQYLTLRAVKVAQQTVRLLSFGRYRPFWVLHLAGHYTAKNREKTLSDSSDSDPYNLRLVLV